MPKNFNDWLPFVKNPKPLMRMVMESITRILSSDPKNSYVAANPRTFEQKHVHEWAFLQKMVKDQIISKNILTSDLNCVSKETFQWLDIVCSDPEFTVKNVKKINSVCSIYCEWVLLVHQFLKIKFEEKAQLLCSKKHLLVSITENPYKFKKMVAKCNGCSQIIRNNIINHCSPCHEDYCNKCI